MVSQGRCNGQPGSPFTPALPHCHTHVAAVGHGNVQGRPGGGACGGEEGGRRVRCEEKVSRRRMERLRLRKARGREARRKEKAGRFLTTTT